MRPSSQNKAGEAVSAATAPALGGWVIELERGWGPWTPGDLALTDLGGSPVQYRIGRSDFEACFTSDVEGTQTNLLTGKVRGLRCLEPGESPPAWEGIGARRRPAGGSGCTMGTKGTAEATRGTAAHAAQIARDERRVAGNYNGLHSRSNDTAGNGKPSQGYSTQSSGVPTSNAMPEAAEVPESRVRNSRTSATIDPNSRLFKNTASLRNSLAPAGQPECTTASTIDPSSRLFKNTQSGRNSLAPAETPGAEFVFTTSLGLSVPSSVTPPLKMPAAIDPGSRLFKSTASASASSSTSGSSHSPTRSPRPASSASSSSSTQARPAAARKPASSPVDDVQYATDLPSYMRPRRSVLAAKEAAAQIPAMVKTSEQAILGWH